MFVRDFCVRVGCKIRISGNLVQSVLTDFCNEGKDDLVQGDQFCMPTLGRFYCTQILAANSRDAFGIEPSDNAYVKVPKKLYTRTAETSYKPVSTTILFHSLCIRVGKRTGFQEPDVTYILRQIFKEARSILCEGDEFRLPGLGRMYCVTRPPLDVLDNFLRRRGILKKIHVNAQKRVRFISDVRGLARPRFRAFQSLLRFVNGITTRPPYPHEVAAANKAKKVKLVKPS